MATGRMRCDSPPEPGLLAIGQSTPNIDIAANRKTFSVKANGWIWTYTPTRLQ